MLQGQSSFHVSANNHPTLERKVKIIHIYFSSIFNS